jgi:membrane protease YdiL (CAAX protease family)
VWLAYTTFVDQFPFSPTLVILTLVSVVPVAFVISMAYSRIPAVKRTVSSLTRLHGVWGWSLLGLALFPVLLLISLSINSLLNRQPIPSHQFPDISLALIGLVIVKFLYQFFFFNATGEEVGWRGFVLPRLQAHTSPLIAALIIAIFWAPWHFFLWQAEGSPVLTWQYWLERYFIHSLASVILVWICNRAQGSILVAGITHAALNTAAAFIPFGDGRFMYLTFFIAVLILIFVDRMWKKLPPDHLAVYRSS